MIAFQSSEENSDIFLPPFLLLIIADTNDVVPSSAADIPVAFNPCDNVGLLLLYASVRCSLSVANTLSFSLWMVS